MVLLPLSEQRIKLILQPYLHLHSRHFYMLFRCFCQLRGGNGERSLVRYFLIPFPLRGNMGQGKGNIWDYYCIYMPALLPHPTYSQGGMEQFIWLGPLSMQMRRWGCGTWVSPYRQLWSENGSTILLQLSLHYIMHCEKNLCIFLVYRWKYWITNESLFYLVEVELFHIQISMRTGKSVQCLFISHRLKIFCIFN